VKRWQNVRTLEVTVHQGTTIRRISHLNSPGQEVRLTDLQLSDLPLRVAGVDPDGKFIFFVPKRFRGWIINGEIVFVVHGPQHIELLDTERAVLVWDEETKVRVSVIMMATIIKIRPAMVLIGTSLMVLVMLVVRALWAK
jgi:hypothetical protein